MKKIIIIKERYMSFSRRDFMKFSAGAAGAALLNNACSGTQTA
ncbi:twin-arginine translocation signal domain-containing protein, partial [Candidatus Woesearchaeota archaeon]|nr:twin-arginine translocation signal domain-containing protein [Candidatus Woesearchaeota archaeon]